MNFKAQPWCFMMIINYRNILNLYFAGSPPQVHAKSGTPLEIETILKVTEGDGNETMISTSHQSAQAGNTSHQAGQNPTDTGASTGSQVPNSKAVGNVEPKITTATVTKSPNVQDPKLLNPEAPKSTSAVPPKSPTAPPTVTATPSILAQTEVLPDQGGDKKLKVTTAPTQALPLKSSTKASDVTKPEKEKMPKSTKNPATDTEKKISTTKSTDFISNLGR
jgi:hypothetical protein